MSRAAWFALRRPGIDCKPHYNDTQTQQNQYGFSTLESKARSFQVMIGSLQPKGPRHVNASTHPERGFDHCSLSPRSPTRPHTPRIASRRSSCGDATLQATAKGKVTPEETMYEASHTNLHPTNLPSMATKWLPSECSSEPKQANRPTPEITKYSPRIRRLLCVKYQGHAHVCGECGEEKRALCDKKKKKRKRKRHWHRRSKARVLFSAPCFACPFHTWTCMHAETRRVWLCNNTSMRISQNDSSTLAKNHQQPQLSYHFFLGGVRRRLCTGCSIPLRFRHSMSQGLDRSWVDDIRSILVDGRRVETRITLSSAHSCCCPCQKQEQPGERERHGGGTRGGRASGNKKHAVRPTGRGVL